MLAFGVLGGLAMAAFIAMAVLGAAFAVGGPFIVKYRVALAEWQAKMYREGGAERSARLVTPRAMIVIGCSAVIVGLGVVCGALLRIFNG